MKKTSLKEKILLNIFGICLALILCEVGLRLAGAVVFYLQERHNHLTFSPGEYRILCLGESTTALGGEDAYPSQLEKMLNAQSQSIKFTVINKGIISTTSDTIVSQLDQNLNTTKPQMVIVMMGINDRDYGHGASRSLGWENFKSHYQDLRVYKLVHLLYMRITHRTKGNDTPAEGDDLSQTGDRQQLEGFLKAVIAESVDRFHEHITASAQYQQDRQLAQAQQENELAKQSAVAASTAYIELARRYRLRGSLQESQGALEKNDVFNLNNQDAFQQWGELYLAQGKNAQAAQAFQSVLALDPKNSDALLGLAHAYYKEHSDNAFFVYVLYLQTKPEDYWGNIELAQWLRDNKHYDQAKIYLNNAIEIASSFDQAYMDWGKLLDDQGQYRQEEAFYLKEISLHPDSTHPETSRFYQALGQFYKDQGRKDLAKEYFLKAAKRGMAEYSPVTLANYSQLLDKILSRRIKVVVMQYPFRDIGILRDYLGPRNGVLFVENRQNFNQALSMGGYWHYFKDNFAFDFGHCTRAGNELIARNLAEVILKNE